ncbi:MAG: orotidine-5'-phosphate decarboxylase [Verrucomicrobiae bacterium]|nr:orotidine-5'-phosphate decarboxylase [Verrucomicrobiae bacterium]
MQAPIMVALDVPDIEGAERLAGQVGGLVGALKVGSELFTACGPEGVRRIRATGARVFLDLKFHDIPHTVARAVRVATRLGVDFLTVHTSGGEPMMRSAVEAAREEAAALGRATPTILGVTVLTSMDAAQLRAVMGETEVAAQVERLARLAVAAGVPGLVCSPMELPLLRRVLPREVVLVTPGIRMGPPAAGDDQKRTLSPAEAMAAGADWIVVGRPIHAAPDPAAAARAIAESMGMAVERAGEGEASGR